MEATQEQKLNDAEKRALLFLGNRMQAEGIDTIESTGIAELAVQEGVAKYVKTFSVLLYRLKMLGLFESVRSGRVYLYTLTPQGMERYLALKEEPKQEATKQTAEPEEKKTMSMKTIEEQLKEKGVDPRTYPASSVAVPKKGAYTEDPAGVLKLYKDRINNKPEQNEIERLNEWFTKLAAEGRPAFEWMQEAICRTSTKVRAEQRTISYLIGILKNWGTYGYGTDYSAEQRKLFTVFENRFKCTLSESARQKFLLMIDQFGIVDTMTSLFETSTEQLDLSMLLLVKMEEHLNSN